MKIATTIIGSYPPTRQKVSSYEESPTATTAYSIELRWNFDIRKSVAADSNQSENHADDSGKRPPMNVDSRKTAAMPSWHKTISWYWSTSNQPLQLGWSLVFTTGFLCQKSYKIQGFSRPFHSIIRGQFNALLPVDHFIAYSPTDTQEKRRTDLKHWCVIFISKTVWAVLLPALQKLQQFTQSPC